MDERDVDTAVLERPGPPAPRSAPRTPNPEELRKRQGLRDLVGGSVLICIGFLFGSSIFMGNATKFDWVFDGLGVFWIAKGIYLLATAKPTASV